MSGLVVRARVDALVRSCFPELGKREVTTSAMSRQTRSLRTDQGDLVFLETKITRYDRKPFYCCLGYQHSVKGVSVMWRKIPDRVYLFDGDIQHLKGLIIQRTPEVPGNLQFSQCLLDPYFPNYDSADKDEVLSVSNGCPRFL